MCRLLRCPRVMRWTDCPRFRLPLVERNESPCGYKHAWEACRSSKSDMPQYPWLSGHRQDSLLAMRMMLCLLLLAILRAVDPDVAATHLEKLALRQQLAVFKSKRPRPWLRQRVRLFWVLLARPWPDWRDALVIVKPATVIGWHRGGFKVFWTWKSRPCRAGRPRVPNEIRELIRRMCRENPLWGGTAHPR